MATDGTGRHQDNLRDELDGATLHTALSAAEGGPDRKDLFLLLAHSEATHSRAWRNKPKAAGVTYGIGAALGVPLSCGVRDLAN